MKLIDTTDPKAAAGAKTLLSGAADEPALALVRRLYFHVQGMYACEVGPVWDSGGRSEGHYLHHLNIVFSGRLRVIQGSRVMDMKPGHAYFTPGNTPVVRRYLRRSKVIFLRFRCEWLPGVDPLLDWPGRRPVDLGAVDLSWWRKWLTPGWKDSANHLLELQSRLDAWMAKALPDLKSLVSRHLETHTRFHDVFARLEEKLGADLRIDELAKVFGTSLHAFSMSFSNHTGMSPKDHLNRRLNQEALHLVIDTDLKMKEIAERLRFNDEYYFNRFFKKLNGVAPARYRHRFRTVS
jgi:AraC-like DNA-binding protein